MLTNLTSGISRRIIKGCFALVVLCILGFQPLPSVVQAEKPEPNAAGSVKFSLADGPITYAEFSAQLHDDGSTTGEMTLTGFKDALEQNLDGTNEEPEESAATPAASSKSYLKASFDCMVVAGTQAVMSGSVTESSSKRYIGRRVLLVVQDRGDGLKSSSADKLTWGVYDPKPRTWVPSDAEVENDSGIATSWLATDAERVDDMGIQSDKQESVGCQSFPFSAFSLVKIKNGDGDIKVRP